MPTPLTSFIGRAPERAEVADAIRHHRLVTTTGPGGVARRGWPSSPRREVAADFADGAVFVDLVKATQPDMVVAAVADAIGVPERVGRSVRNADRRPRRPQLPVVMDNCEHVQDAARVCIERLLTSCPEVNVLATSRLRLMLPFEHVRRCPRPVDGRRRATPTPCSSNDWWRRVRRGRRRPPSSTPFGESARRSKAWHWQSSWLLPECRASDSTGCRTRSNRDCEILSVGSRADDRHRSLRAAIDWTYELLDTAEQAVLRATAVFAASFDVAAACQVVDVAPAVVREAIAGLVDWNLVSIDAGTPSRYRMLETIRQYASERAESLGENEAIRSRHAAWCRTRLDELSLRVPGDDAWCDELDGVLDDARAALAWMLEDERRNADAIVLAGLLADTLFQRGHPGEAQRRYQQAATLAAEPGDQCAGFAWRPVLQSARNVGGDTVDLLMQSASIARAAGALDAAAHDLAALPALQYRAQGIISRPVQIDVSTTCCARLASSARGAPHAEAAIAVAARMGSRRVGAFAR